MTLGQALANVAGAYPNREAVIFGQQRLLYRELAARVNALAYGLQQLGIGRGDKVALLLPNSPEFIFAFFAVGNLGAVVVPLNPLYRRWELEHILTDSEAKAVITVSDAWGNPLLDTILDLRPSLPGLKHIIVHGDQTPPATHRLHDLMNQALPSDEPLLLAQPEDLFGLIYTSGTTGMPKGTMHTHRTMMAPVVANDRLRQMMFGKPSLQTVKRVATIFSRYGTRFAKYGGRQQTMLTPSPFHAMAGYGLMLNTLLFGYRIVVLPRFDPRRVLELIEKEEVNVLSATPTMYSLMLSLPDFDRYNLSSLLYCVMGAAPCPPELVRRVRERVGCAVIISFGATELAGGTLITRIDDPEDLGTETVGRVFPDTEIKIVDENRHELPPGQVGELACRMGGVMAGYYKDPEATAQALDDEGWYYTGDLAVMDEKGYVRIVGRKKDMIIRGGQNIFPVEIEHYLLEHPLIEGAAVVGVPNPLGGESVWAYVVSRDDAQLTARDVLDYCRGNIAPYKVPDQVRFVDEFPLTPTGKVQKFKLRQLALEELKDRDSSPDPKGL